MATRPMRLLVGPIEIQGSPGIGPSRTIPEYGPPFFSPKYFPIHIMYYQFRKADRPAIRDTNHPFSVPNHKRTKKTGSFFQGIVLFERLFYYILIRVRYVLYIGPTTLVGNFRFLNGKNNIKLKISGCVQNVLLYYL